MSFDEEMFDGEVSEDELDLDETLIPLDDMDDFGSDEDPDRDH